MKFDKLTCFCEKIGETEFTVAKTAETEKVSQVVDLRYNGDDFGNKLYVFATAVLGKGVAAPANGAVTTDLETSDNGSAWTSVDSVANVGATLMAIVLPKGVKRFLRLKFTVGKTALAADISVKAGLTDTVENEGPLKLQTFPPLEDLAASGDAVVTSH